MWIQRTWRNSAKKRRLVEGRPRITERSWRFPRGSLGGVHKLPKKNTALGKYWIRPITAKANFLPKKKKWNHSLRIFDWQGAQSCGSRSHEWDYERKQSYNQQLKYMLIRRVQRYFGHIWEMVTDLRSERAWSTRLLELSKVKRILDCWNRIDR